MGKKQNKVSFSTGNRNVAIGRWVQVGILTAVILFLLVLVVLFMSMTPNSSPSQAESESGSTAPMPTVIVPSASVPTSSQETGPDLSFSAEQTAQMDAMLDEWAKQPSYVTVTNDEDGNALAQPYDSAVGSGVVSVWYMDVESGTHYTYNDDVQQYYASTMKAPYVAYLFTLAEKGLCDLQEIITISQADVQGLYENTGVIKEMPLPTSLSVQQLMEYAITDSDTVALRVLLNHYDAEGFLEWAVTLGIDETAADEINSVIYGQITASDMGVFLQEIYRVMTENSHGDSLRTWMEQANNKMITSSYPVAHKYGWDIGAYHDMAVVFADRPYLLVVMTDKWGGGYDEMLVFGDVAQKLEEIMAQQYTAAGL